MSIKALAESCVARFEQLLAPPDGLHAERLESRMADFSLWADGVGAMARPGTSLDSRLLGRVSDVLLVKSILQMLDDSLAFFASLDDRSPNVDGAFQNLDSAIQNLALIGVAIRRTGKASRNRRADRTFKPDRHEEFRRYLECVVLLRPSEDALFRLKDDGECVSIARLHEPELSDLQQRLVDANLRRRHNFLVAQKRVVDQARNSLLVVPDPFVSLTNENVVQKEPSRASDETKGEHQQQSAPIAPAVPEVAPQADPSIAGFTHASTAEGTLRYTPRTGREAPVVARTQITSIASLADFPRPPLVSLQRTISQCPLCCQSLPIDTFRDPETWKYVLTIRAFPFGGPNISITQRTCCYMLLSCDYFQLPPFLSYGEIGQPHIPPILPDITVYACYIQIRKMLTCAIFSRKHIIEDLCPYTCIAENCATPALLFCTRKEWETHVKEAHAPRWQCPFCDGNESTTTEHQPGPQTSHQAIESQADMEQHLLSYHADELYDKPLSTFVSWSAVHAFGIKSCPLCDSHGPEDAPELVDHVLEHTYDFAMRALPWPEPVEHDLHTYPGSFKVPLSDEGQEQPVVNVPQWLSGVDHEAKGTLKLALCNFDTAIHTPPDRPSMPEHTGYFKTYGYFKDIGAAASLDTQDIRSSTESDSSMDSDVDSVYGYNNLVAISMDDTRITLISKRRAVELWNTETGEYIRTLDEQYGKTNAVIFIAGSLCLLSASEDSTIKLWEASMGTCLRTYEDHTDAVKALVSFPNDEYFASASDDCTVKLWSVLGPECLMTFRGHTGPVTSIDISPNGARIASASKDDTIKLWEAGTGCLIQTFRGQNDAVSSVCFWICFWRGYRFKDPTDDDDHNNRDVASISRYGTAKLWDEKTGKCQETIDLLSDVDKMFVLRYGPSTLEATTLEHDYCMRTHMNERVWDSTGVSKPEPSNVGEI